MRGRLLAPPEGTRRNELDYCYTALQRPPLGDGGHIRGGFASLRTGLIHQAPRRLRLAARRFIAVVVGTRDWQEEFQ